MSKPTPVEPNDVKNTVAPPMFCISEHHGSQQHKYRVIDDHTWSQVNSAAYAQETYCPHDLDNLAAQIRTLASMGRSDFLSWSVDSRVHTNRSGYMLPRRKPLRSAPPNRSVTFRALREF